MLRDSYQTWRRDEVMVFNVIDINWAPVRPHVHNSNRITGTSGPKIHPWRAIGSINAIRIPHLVWEFTSLVIFSESHAN
ncbi:unnamed protein product, partial [Iphiclides podalirius]